MWSPKSEKSREWAKLDLLPHHIRRLVLVWVVPYSEEAVELFGDLLDEEGAFSSLLSYSKHRVRHHRIESARVGFDESDDLSITIHYEAGDSMLSHIPKEAEEPAWLLDPLIELGLELPVSVRSVFEFPAGAYRSVVPLPLAIPPPAEHPDAFDQIVGIHGVRKPGDGDEGAGGHDFTLDLDRDGGLVLSLEFYLPAVPVDDVPERALRDALTTSGSIVVPAR
jgi:hypothetical protein